MVTTCVNCLSSQAIAQVPAACVPILDGQNSGEGVIVRVRLRIVRRIEGLKDELALSIAII
jgi:hypothetical protein